MKPKPKNQLIERPKKGQINLKRISPTGNETLERSATNKLEDINIVMASRPTSGPAKKKKGKK